MEMLEIAVIKGLNDSFANHSTRAVITKMLSSEQRASTIL